MSDDEEESPCCPLCVEEMDLSDKNFLPCPCGYRVCMWCWHHIRENLNGLCPACRTPYNADPHVFAAVDRSEVVKKNKERRQKEKLEKKVSDRPVTALSASAAGPASSKQPTAAIVDRRHLHNYRVVQRNLVYVIGVPVSIANEDLLKKAEYFGQYGRIGKIVIHRNHSASHTTVSAYITFVFKEDAKACIHVIDGLWLEGHVLRASFGTTKYCNNFIRGVACNNPDCVYLHELGDDDDRFTKEEIQQAGHSKLTPVPGKDQTLVTGSGGPSGTGKRPTGEPVLPQPIFVQDNPSPAAASVKPPTLSRSATWTGGADARPTSPVAAQQQTSSAAKSSPPVAGKEGASAADVPAKAVRSTSHNDLVATAAKIVAGVKSTAKDTKPSAAQSAASENKSDPAESTEQGSSKAAGDVETKQAVGIAARDGADAKYTSSTAGVDAKPASAIDMSSFSNDRASSSFNGLSRSAVFPIPVSSLHVTVWSNILGPGASSDDLMVNPFSQFYLPLSELLDLTLPPVDAMGTHPWPKPQAYYRQGPAQSQLLANAFNGSAATTTTANSTPHINALKQLFPGVNMSIASK